MGFKIYILVISTLAYIHWNPVRSDIDDYKLYPGVGYYRIVNISEAKTWMDAFDDCGVDGGHLIIINSAAEAEVFKDVINTPGYTGTYYWAGITDLYTTGRFYDIKGNSINDTGYVVWRPDNPDTEGINHCLELHSDAAYANNYCTNEYAYVCEIELTPNCTL